MVDACDLSIMEMGAGRSEVQGPPWLYSLGYLYKTQSLGLRENNNNNNNNNNNSNNNNNMAAKLPQLVVDFHKHED